MRAQIRKLREERANLAQKMQALIAKARGEDRDMSSEESTEWDRMNTRVDEAEAEAVRLERQLELDSQLSQSRGRQTDTLVADPPDSRETTPEDRARALRAWAGQIVPQFQATERDLEACRRVGLDPRSGVLLSTPSIEARDLQTGTTSAGGYAVPDEMMRGYTEVQALIGPMRKLATKVNTVTGADLPWPTVTDTGNSATIVGEGTAIATTTDPTFGQLTLKSYKYATTVVLVSWELIQDAWMSIPQLLGSQLGKRMARGQSAHFTTGTGSSQPKGIVTGATVGKTAAATNAITYAELIDLVHSVDPLYRAMPSCAFSMADTTVAAIRKLLDSDNRPLWSLSVQAGQPDRLLGYPLYTNPNMAAIAASAKTICFGDHGAYIVRDAGSVEFVRLNELYAASGQVGFLAFQRSDGNLPDSTAVKYLVQAT